MPDFNLAQTSLSVLLIRKSPSGAFRNEEIAFSRGNKKDFRRQAAREIGCTASALLHEPVTAGGRVYEIWFSDPIESGAGSSYPSFTIYEDDGPGIICGPVIIARAGLNGRIASLDSRDLEILRPLLQENLEETLRSASESGLGGVTTA